jgi:hypothetical protein
VPADVAWPDGSDVRRLPAPDPAPPARAPGRARLERQRGHRARVHRVPRHLRGGVAQGLPRPAPGEPLQRRLLAARHRARRAADPPIRNSMAGAGMVVEDSKGECNFGQHEINFHYADALRTADEHVDLQERRQGDRRREGMAITFMAKLDEREGNSCHIHFSLADKDGPLFARDEELFDSFLAGQLACLREMTLLLAPHVNSYKRFAAGSASRRPPSRGATTTAPARCASSGTARAALREPRRRRRPEPLPGAERADRLRPARDRRGPRARAGARGQRLRRQRAPAAADQTLRDARELFAPARSRARPSARRSSRTTSTPPTSSSRHSSPRHRLGARARGSSCERDCERPSREPDRRSRSAPDASSRRSAR